MDHSWSPLMDPPPSPSTHEDYRAEVERFYQARDANKRTDFLGRDFYLVPAVTEAVINSLPRLLEATYARNNRSLPRNKPTELHACLPLFYTLLDLGQGHLVHRFKESDQHTLPITLPTLEHLFPRHEFGDFAQTFYDRQWKWCPLKFDYRMGIRLSDEERIVPITKETKITPARDSIPKPDRKATLWVVEVPAELVDEELKEKLRDKDDDNNKSDESADPPPATFRFVVKQFSKNKKEEFEREQDLFNTLGEQPGIVQYLGWYESRQPTRVGPERQNAESETFYNLVLELGDQDLYSAFQKENPPVHFHEIRLFWRSLFDVADALASIQTIARASFTDYVWHGDIKPENILDVETGFKLADPGEAVVVKVGSSDQVNPRLLKTRVPGGTRTFAAPEKTAYSPGEPEPEVTQGIDIWSLGCVYSVAATFAVLGKEGVKQYRLLRQKAISERGGSKMGDSFHDGESVLPEIAIWHRFLVACLRKDDTYTAKVLEIVDKQMLIMPGEDRITGAELSDALATIHNSADGYLPTEVPGEINDFLTEELGPRRTGQSNLEDVPRTISQSGTEMFEEALLYASRTSEGRPPARRQLRDAFGPSQYAAQVYKSSGPINNSFFTPSRGGPGPPRLQTPQEEPVVPERPKEPPTTMWQVEADLQRWGVSTELFGKLFGKSKKSVYGKSLGGKPDRLENHFANRDIVYLVDNASSMANNWGHVTYLLRILVWRSLHYDDDGMELKFTIGSEDWNLKPTKKQKVDDFVKRMQMAVPKPEGGKVTDMSASLSLILERHFKNHRDSGRSQIKRKLTVLVLTDGLWEGNDEYDVDNYLVNCIQKIPDEEWKPEPDGGVPTSRKPPSRPISIQFIRFGHNDKAIERLDRLDNHLKDRAELAGRFLPDVIDTEEANGDVYKMFLGSMLDDFDNKSIEGASVVTPVISRQSSFLHPNFQTPHSAPLPAQHEYFPDATSVHRTPSSRSPSRSPSSATQRPRSVSRQEARKSAPVFMTAASRTGTNTSMSQQQAYDHSAGQDPNYYAGGNYSHQTPSGSSATAQLGPVPRRSTGSFGGGQSQYGSSNSRSVSPAYQTTGPAHSREDRGLPIHVQQGHQQPHEQSQHWQQYQGGYYGRNQNY
ncbi:hypothetical protein V8F20_003439 [Naviculisporaceae sp. PSN 640]